MLYNKALPLSVHLSSEEKPARILFELNTILSMCTLELEEAMGREQALFPAHDFPKMYLVTFQNDF